MATATTSVVGGGYATSRAGFATAVTGGAALANASVPWNTSAPKPKGAWIPALNVPHSTCPNCKTALRFDKPWADFFQHIADVRLGGQYGPTVPQVATSVTQTQAQVVATANYTDAVAGYARGIAGTVDALTDVAQSNSLSGATTVPDTPEPPARPTAGTQVA